MKVEQGMLASRSRISLALLLAVLVAVFSLWHFVNKTESVYRHGYFDLPIFVQASIRHWRGEAIYIRSDDLAETYKPGAIVFKFPPPYLLHFVPWFDASGKWPPYFRQILTFIYIAIYAATVFLALGLVSVCRKIENKSIFLPEYLVFLSLAVAFSAMYLPGFIVQGATSAEGYIGFLMVVAFVAMRRYPWLAGFLLAWLACLKLYPAFLLLYPLLTRQWRVLMAAGLSGILIAMVSLLVFGAQENLFYLQKVLPVLLQEPASEDWTTMFQHTTGSLGLVKKLVEYGVLPNRLPIWINAVRLPFVLGLLFLLWRYARQHNMRSWVSVLGFALLLPTMLICLPNVFYPYYILLLFPAIALLGYCWSQQYWGWLFLLLIFLSCLLVDDNWTYALSQQIVITPEVTTEAARVGITAYLWRHEPLLQTLNTMGAVVPFLPVVLWIGLAAALRAAATKLSRAQTPA